MSDSSPPVPPPVLPTVEEPDTECDNDVGRCCRDLWPDSQASWCPGCLQAALADSARQLAALRDALEQQQAIVAAFSEFVHVERARRDEQGRGGQSVGYSPRISPSVLKELERLLLTAPQESVKEQP